MFDLNLLFQKSDLIPVVVQDSDSREVLMLGFTNQEGYAMDSTLEALYQVVLDRKAHPQEGSYTCYLFDKGLDKILKKVGEECAETIIAAKNDVSADTVGEVSDLIYHLLVMLAEKDIPLDGVLAELDRRAQKIGNLKQMKQVDKES